MLRIFSNVDLLMNLSVPEILPTVVTDVWPFSNRSVCTSAKSSLISEHISTLVTEASLFSSVDALMNIEIQWSQ